MTNFYSNRSARWVRFLLGVCIVQFALLLALSLVWNRQLLQQTDNRPRPYSITNQEPTFAGKPGPWGSLEYVRINIEPPDQFLQVDGDFEPAQWFFDDYSPEKLSGFFSSLKLTPSQQAELLNASAWRSESNGIAVRPSNDLIWSLSPEVRARIYSTLSLSERNEFQYTPYTYRAGELSDWLGIDRLPAATMELVKKLVYRRGDSLCFSDLPQLFANIPASADKKQLVKALSRSSALLMKLRVNSQTDTAALTSYWSIGGRAKDIEPLLNSLVEVPGSATVDIVHLLPPFARKRINTYPQPTTDPTKAPANCFWTVMNFFNDPPDDRYLDNSVWRDELVKNYTVVEKPTFGDLIFLAQPDNTPIHAAVYIADDVVFTKNGGNECQPWILMKMDDMLARYPKDYPLRLFVFRKSATAP